MSRRDGRRQRDIFRVPLPSRRFAGAASRPAEEPEHVPLVAERGVVVFGRIRYRWLLALHIGEF